MELIDKAALVAEIVKKTHGEQGYSSGDAECAYRDCAKEILSFLDTLKVKEVDLEKALSDLDKDIKEFVTTEEFEKDSAIYGHYWAIAKYAFLLGIKSKRE